MTTEEKRYELKRHIKEVGLTQVSLAEMFEVSQANINALLNGKTAFGKKVALSWEEKLGIRSAWLLTGDGDMLKKPYPQSAGGSEVVDGLGIIKDFYEIIREQTSMLKSQLEIKDQQMNGIIESMKTKDQQMTDTLALLKEQIKKGNALSEGANSVVPHVAEG